MTALVIIDVQNDFLPGGRLAVPGGDLVLPVINELQTCFSLVVATQDWHPPDHMSFAINHSNQKEFDTIKINDADQMLWPEHCVQSTPGANFSEELEMNRVEAIFRKGMNRQIDSYSAFFDNQHLKATSLEHYLKGRGVDTVCIVGLAGDYCVYYSAKDALQLKFTTIVIEDATIQLTRKLSK